MLDKKSLVVYWFILISLQYRRISLNCDECIFIRKCTRIVMIDIQGVHSHWNWSRQPIRLEAKIAILNRLFRNPVSVEVQIIEFSVLYLVILDSCWFKILFRARYTWFYR